MKKQVIIKYSIILAILIATMTLLTGCGESKNTQSAEEIINNMKNENSNIGKVVVYTESTDLNKLLGRPGQYTSKVSFEDKRLEQENANNEFMTEEERNEPTGGTIEVFSNASDMKKRKEYIEGFSTSSMFSQYIYSKDNVLLRVDGDLTPSQAKEYEELLNKIVE